MILGEYLMNAQGEDVVAGVRTPMPISELAKANPAIYKQFEDTCATLEKHYRDMQDIEFTIEHGVFFILQCRSGKRTGPAAVKIAVDHVSEGLITKAEAIARVEPNLLTQCLLPVIPSNAKYKVIAKGLPAGPGAATGTVVFSSEKAAELGKGGAGERVILVRADTNPDDLKGMLGAQGVLTERGGMTSHAALVARGFGIPTVAGCAEISVGPDSFTVVSTGQVIKEGEYISLNGAAGEVIEGQVPVEEAKMTGDFGRFSAGPTSSGEIRGSHERRHARRHEAGDLPWRRGHRAVPHRAHVLRGRAAPGRPADDPVEERRRAAGRPRRITCLSARGLPGYLRGPRRPSRDHSPDRSAAA